MPDYKFFCEVDFFQCSALNNFQKHLSHFKDVPCHFVEIGSLEGRSATWTLDNILTHSESTLTCIDLNTGNTLNTLYANLSYHQGKVNVKVMDSVHALAELISSGYLFEFIYVDGQHDEHIPLYDMVLSHELLHIGGIMGIDDYLMPAYTEQYGYSTVHECVDAFMTIYGKKYEILDNFPSDDYQKWLRKLSS